MIGNPNVKKVLYGGDWNYEQWTFEENERDLAMLKKAGIDVVTLNVFNWAKIQPSEDRYDFSDLDRIVELSEKSGVKICMATGTAALPAWMAKRHPDILRVNKDNQKQFYGGRHNFCPQSPTFRKYGPLLAKKVAERYGGRESVVAWHVSNEYGPACYCENCKNGFHEWLKKKYGSIENLNRNWNTSFWGHTYYDFCEIEVSSNLSEEWGGCHTTCQIQTIDYKRFQSDALLECFCLERDAIFSVTKRIPVTTNFMGAYPELDYHKWAKEMDFVSWDNYPSPNVSHTNPAFNHEIMRGCKIEKPFCLMEQTPSVTNWQPYNSLKRPGVMRLLSYQALARGADTVMFFQMRRSRGCCEKFHGAVIDHFPSEEARVYKEIAALGAELSRIGPAFLGSLQKNKIALLFDWNCMWGVSLSAGPSESFNYTNEVYKYFDAFAKQNIGIDVIDPRKDFSSYEAVFAPALYMLSDEVAKKIEDFVFAGGTFFSTTMSGMADENDLVTTEGYPGKLRKVLGVWAEETDALLPNQKNSFVVKEGELKGEYEAVILCDIVHAEGAKVLASYGSDFYAGSPCLTENAFGKGKAYYAASCFPEGSALLERLVQKIASEKGVFPVLPKQDGIEATRRVCSDGREFVFVLNHGAKDAEARIPFCGTEIISQKKLAKDETLFLKAKDAAIILKE